MQYRHLPLTVTLLSFEGPDRFSFVGGLGVRVTELATALGRAGFDTRVFFIGDPDKPGQDTYSENVRLYRWCQWISRFHPGGVYDGEGGKINDYAASVPPFLISEVIRPAYERNQRVLVLAEDWQVVPAVLHLDRALFEAGLRQAAIIAWNANNTYGFETIDWPALSRAAHITAVSKYMKFELALRGVQSLVVPNGIPREMVAQDHSAAVNVLKKALKTKKTLLKVGRYDPDKRWMQAIDALAELRHAGTNVQLIVRGGKEAYGDLVMARAAARNLSIEDLRLSESTPAQLAQALAHSSADIVNLRSFLPNETLYALYGAVNAVLANSGKEPFGLVGLEVMASGGIPVCGSTGEDYARPFENAIVCDTDDPNELAAYLTQLFDDPSLATRIRKQAAKTASDYTWDAVFEILDTKLGFLAASG